MILREFLYVDTDKVRAMLAQLDGGVAEESRRTERTEKRTTVGPRMAAQHFQGSSGEEYTNKSLGDALFPMLEDALESEGLLSDISLEVSDIEKWNSGEIKQSLPPGSLVRVTAVGSFFDARYVASAFSAFASVNAGLAGLGFSPDDTPSVPTGARGTQGKAKSRQGNQSRLPKNAPPAVPAELEDLIPEFPSIDGVDRTTLRSFVQISRGVFNPGLHINLTPVKDVLISARLQEGRQYLDSEADILLARYGAEPQELTLMGSIGSYGTEEKELPDQNFMNDDGVMSRGSFAEVMNSQMRSLGRIGFIDLPQHPGFSLIPFAVYRSIPRPGRFAPALH
ncbi:hypothetical protein [Streptomyces halstedii]|uniref:Uncharacterized protein n=1 Tax=Streptomyces halstedii TaxID=1944 RepID=A0A6N9U1G1_STRHA|nr:hypothetical protein [Streptomyces halstedii]NEA16599.1 hypothetical protein [Streptomyces halstedii]